VSVPIAEMPEPDRTMWKNLLALAIEAANAFEDAERDWCIQAIAEDPNCVTYEVDDKDVVHVFIAGRKVVTAHKLALTRPTKTIDN